MKKEKNNVDATDSASDDLTDEFPALDIEAMALAGKGYSDEELTKANFAINSLSQLEDDIHHVQARWSAVESDLCKRDAEIEELNQELSTRQSALTQMTNELNLAHEKHQDLIGKLKDAEIEKDELMSQIVERENSVQSREAEIENKQAEIDSINDERDNARHKLRQSEKRLENQGISTKDAEASAEALEQKSNELKVKVQDLEAYVDRRKEDWQKLHDDIAAYESTILGMEKVVREKDEAIALHQKETVEVSAAIIELEQQYAELDGRRAERELASRELQDKLVTASQDVERLNRETERLEAALTRKTTELTDRHVAELAAINAENSAATEALSEKLQNQDERIDELNSSLEDERKRADAASSGIVRTEKELSAERGRTGKLEGELNLRTAELADLRELFEDQERKSAEVCQELQTTYDRLQEANSELREHGASINDHEAALERYTEKLASAERELAARDQLVSALETDLQGQKDTIEILNRNVQRLNELGTYVKTLDERISSQVGEHAGDESKVETEMRDGSDTPCIVSTETDQPIKYPLFKNNMVIGRSSAADIQLRWKFISREHARIVLDGPAATIEDLGSKNGIYVNNESIVRRELHNGDRLEIGELQFTFISAMH
jgi:chromosome segregation ATPase